MKKATTRKRPLTKAIKADDDQFALTADELTDMGALEKLEIPELPKGGQPGVVWIRRLFAEEVIDFSTGDRAGGSKSVVHLIAMAVVDKKGNPLFSPDDVDRIRRLQIPVFRRLSTAVMRLTQVSLEEEGNA